MDYEEILNSFNKSFATQGVSDVFKFRLKSSIELANKLKKTNPLDFCIRNVLLYYVSDSITEDVTINKEDETIIKELRLYCYGD